MTSTDGQSHRGVTHGGTVCSAGASASSLLRELLTREGSYRRRWRAEVRRASRNDPHQSAVAIVLAQYLWDMGEAPESDADLPRRLKDVVARAVGGGGISHQTLGWFVGAFEMTEDDERALWHRHEADQLAHRSRATPAPRRGPVPPDTTAPPHTTAGPGGTASPASAGVGGGVTAVLGLAGSGATYRTQSLLEVFTVDEHRSRSRHSWVHVVRAQGQLDRLSYRFDTGAVSVEVARGGTPARREPDELPGGHTVDVIFPEPLEPGQMTVVETTATYPPGGPAVTEFRRPLRATAGGVSLEVHFDPRAVPERVRWTELGRSEPGLLHTEGTPRPATGVVHRFLTPDRDCLVGFEWDW